MTKKYFFGWENIKWFIREFVKIYSSEPSFFSKKRVESSIAFLSGIGVMLFYIYSHRNVITNSEMLADVTILFMISGYALAKIQEEKKDIRHEQLPPDNSQSQEPGSPLNK